MTQQKEMWIGFDVPKLNKISNQTDTETSKAAVLANKAYQEVKSLLDALENRYIRT